MLSLLKNWKYIIILMLSVVIGVLAWQNNSLQESVVEKEKEIASLEASNGSLSTTLNTLRESNEKQALRLENISSKATALEAENNRLQSVLGGYKDREEVVVKKPKLIQRRANDATAKLMCDYARATNADTDC